MRVPSALTARCGTRGDSLGSTTLSLAHPLTLKQKNNENGSVTRTSSHETAVMIHPQSPIPTSRSSAEMDRRELVFCYNLGSGYMM